MKPNTVQLQPKTARCPGGERIIDVEVVPCGEIKSKHSGIKVDNILS